MATRSIMIAKLHGLRVTGAELHYEGSIELDPEACEAVGLMPFEFVEIWNKNSGARISTYIIYGERGSCCCVLNGAAARTAQAGDELIIAARATIETREWREVRPRVAVFDGATNQVRELYEFAFKTDARGWNVVREEIPLGSRCLNVGGGRG